MARERKRGLQRERESRGWRDINSIKAQDRWGLSGYHATEMEKVAEGCCEGRRDRSLVGEGRSVVQEQTNRTNYNIILIQLFIYTHRPLY